jgi:hypothetical protein
VAIYLHPFRVGDLHPPEPLKALKTRLDAKRAQKRDTHPNSQEPRRNWVESGIFAGMAKDKAPALSVRASHEVLRLIAEIDEFKGRWEALKTLSPERLRALRHVATIESIGSSTRIEGVKLTDRQIETLLANLRRNAFKSRDEQEVAGYAEAMALLFQSSEELRLTENHLKQLHAVLLKFSTKDEHHRGQYKRKGQAEGQAEGQACKLQFAPARRVGSFDGAMKTNS